MRSRVVLAIPKLDAGGPAKVFYSLAIGFHKVGFEPVVVVNETGGFFWERLPVFIERRVLLPARKSSRYPFNEFATIMMEVHPDVIIATLGSVITATFAKWFRQCRYPLVLRPANHLTQNAKELMKVSPLKHFASWMLNILTLYTANFIICQSEDLYKDFRWYGVSKTKLITIGNPISVPHDDVIQQLLVLEERKCFNLIAVGRLSAQKGFDILIDAINQVKGKMPYVHLTIFGDGPDRYLLESQIESLGLRDHICLAGFFKDTAYHIVNADFVVSSSRYEGFPNVILESLSYGTPVIASDCPGGTREMVKNGITGWLCRAASVDSLAEVIEKAFNSPKFDRRNIRQYISARFSTEKIVRLYADALSKVSNKEMEI